MSYSRSLARLIEELSKLPGIGTKTAERLTFHLLKASREEVLALAEAIRAVKEDVKHCQECFNLTEESPCAICADLQRNHQLICIVEQPKDLIVLEKSGSYRGLYHVLLGRIAPLDGEHPESLTLEPLRQRVKKSLEGPSAQAIQEVIVATNPNLEGDATALYIANMLQEMPVKVTRIARGIPSGSSIEFANQAILTDALIWRQEMEKKRS